MSYFGEVIIKDNFGWERKVELGKPLVLIGSAPSNDVCLPEAHGGGVAPIHLQLICSGKTEESFRLFNISDMQVSIMEQSTGFEVPLLPGQARLIGKEDVLRIGEFLLNFKLLTSEAVVNEQRTENIGMSLELPETTLHPGEKLSGLICVKNFGARKRCQFELDLYGLPDDCYQVAPAPLLYPGAEEKLLIRFFHRKTRPAAGPCEIVIRATAAASYPTEQILIHQVLNVVPVLDYEMEIEDEKQEEEIHEEETVPPAPVQKKPVRIQAVNPDVQEPQPVVVAAADLPRSSRAREAVPVQTSWTEEVEEEAIQEVAPPVVPENLSSGIPAREETLQPKSAQGVIEQEKSEPLGETISFDKTEQISAQVEELQQQEPEPTQVSAEDEVLQQKDLETPETTLQAEEISETIVIVETEMEFEVEEAPASKVEPEIAEIAVPEDSQLFPELEEIEERQNVSDDDWWGDDDDFQGSLGKRNQGSFNRNVRSRLTRNEVQVIRASKEEDDNEMEHE